MQSERKLLYAFGKSRTVWIVSATSCITRYMTDSRYLPTDRESSVSRATTQRTANSSFTICDGARTPQEQVSYKVLSVMETGNIQRGEEKFASYGPSYNFDRFVCFYLFPVEHMFLPNCSILVRFLNHSSCALDSIRFIVSIHITSLP